MYCKSSGFVELSHDLVLDNNSVIAPGLVAEFLASISDFLRFLFMLLLVLRVLALAPEGTKSSSLDSIIAFFCLLWFLDEVLEPAEWLRPPDLDLTEPSEVSPSLRDGDLDPVLEGFFGFIDPSIFGSFLIDLTG